jgi:hypothetical protein
MLPRTYIDTNFLVTGKTIYKEDYWYCSSARQYEELCGEKGKHYEIVDNFEAIY